MRRITAWALSTLTTLVLLFSYHTSTAGSGGAVVASSPAVDGRDASAAGSADSASGATTYTGDAAQTRWGPVKVRITVADGRITAAEAVVYPTGNQRDVEINSSAIPVLNDEVVQAQSAEIDMVSGASVTSEGYLTSLQSAIDRAGL